VNHYFRFDFSALHEKGGESRILAREQSNEVISNLHKILKPFLLRRIKSDGMYNFIFLIRKKNSNNKLKNILLHSGKFST